MSDKPKFFLKSGALMCEIEILGLTQRLTDAATIEFYGGKFFVCETIKESAARQITDALGGEFTEVKP